MLNKKCYKYVKYVKYLKYMSNIVQHSTTFAPPLETLHAPPGGCAPQFKNPWYKGFPYKVIKKRQAIFIGTSFSYIQRMSYY